jgi:hypothetical protein
VTIGKKHLTRLTPDDVRAIKSSLASLTSAHDDVQIAASTLASIKGLDNEVAKLRRSADGLKWERQAVDERMTELLGQAKRAGGCCTVCGCAVACEGATCGYCGRVNATHRELAITKTETLDE